MLRPVPPPVSGTRGLQPPPAPVFGASATTTLFGDHQAVQRGASRSSETVVFGAPVPQDSLVAAQNRQFGLGYGENTFRGPATSRQAMFDVGAAPQQPGYGGVGPLDQPVFGVPPPDQAEKEEQWKQFLEREKLKEELYKQWEAGLIHPSARQGGGPPPRRSGDMMDNILNMVMETGVRNPTQVQCTYSPLRFIIHLYMNYDLIIFSQTLSFCGLQK